MDKFPNYDDARVFQPGEDRWALDHRVWSVMPGEVRFLRQVRVRNRLIHVRLLSLRPAVVSYGQLAIGL